MTGVSWTVVAIGVVAGAAIWIQTLVRTLDDPPAQDAEADRDADHVDFPW